MAQYPKPSGNSGTFNNGNFNNNQTGGLTIAEGLKYFVSYPKTQTPSTIIANNFSTTGNLDVAGDSQFGGDVNFLGGVSITGGIVFKDNVEVQGTTTLDDTLLCLTTTTMDGELTVNNNILLNPGLTTPTVAPYIELTNGVAGEYCQLYLDPQLGYDMTLYTNQTTGGGLTIRGANGQSFTMNPASVQGGSGCQFQNPVDMNNNSLSGLTNVYADGSSITFIDSVNSAMLQLTNNGHTSYENINMNTNDISNVNIVSFGGNNCSISAQSDFNPNILTISNTSPYANNGQIYFQMLNSGGTAFSPMSITSGGIYCGENLILSGYNINGIGSISGNGGSGINCLSNFGMNNNTISNVNLAGATTTTQPLGTNNTSLASTAFVIANLPSTSNFAQLITGSTQTFTGPINFTAATKYNNNQVATINQLPYNTTSTISNYTLLSPTNINLNSGFTQISTYYPSTGQAIFLSYPISITVTAYVGVNQPLCYIKFSPAPFPSYPPQQTTGQIATTLTTGGVNLAGYSWGQIGTDPILQINMPYNVGNGSTITINLASLGMITV